MKTMMNEWKTKIKIIKNTPDEVNQEHNKQGLAMHVKHVSRLSKTEFLRIEM